MTQHRARLACASLLGIIVIAGSGCRGAERHPRSAAPQWTATGDRKWHQFGYVVGTAGDVDGDGLDDVLVIAPRYPDDKLNSGRAYVYHGSRSGIGNRPDWEARSSESWNAYGQFGLSAGAAGDFNCDGWHSGPASGPASTYRPWR